MKDMKDIFDLMEEVTILLEIVLSGAAARVVFSAAS